MLSEIQGIQSGAGLADGQNLAASKVQKVKEEFLTYFYKEILKQAIKMPDLSLGENENNSVSKIFTSDLMAEKLAQELVQSGAFSPAALFPSIAENRTETIK